MVLVHNDRMEIRGCRNGALRRKHPVESALTRTLAVSPDGRLLAMGSLFSGVRGRMAIIKLSDGSVVTSRRFPGPRLSEPVWQADGKSIVFGTVQGVQTMSVTGKHWTILPDSGGRLYGFAVSRQGAVAADLNGKVVLWRDIKRKPLLLATHKGDIALYLAFSSDSRHLVGGYYRSPFSMWDVASGRRVRTWDPRWARRPVALFVPGDGSTAIAVHETGDIIDWSTRWGARIRERATDGSPPPL